MVTAWPGDERELMGKHPAIEGCREPMVSGVAVPNGLDWWGTSAPPYWQRFKVVGWNLWKSLAGPNAAESLLHSRPRKRATAASLVFSSHIAFSATVHGRWRCACTYRRNTAFMRRW